MKHTYQYLKLAVSAAVMAMLFSGTVLGAGKEGPGMAEGQPVAGLQRGRKSRKRRWKDRKSGIPGHGWEAGSSRRFCGLPGRTDL